jgi:hypothetical protein
LYSLLQTGISLKLRGTIIVSNKKGSDNLSKQSNQRYRKEKEKSVTQKSGSNVEPNSYQASQNSSSNKSSTTNKTK